jgi:DNA primase
MKLEHLTFTETVERLADRIGYTLRYEAGGVSTGPSINRSRLVAANTAASIFYQEALIEMLLKTLMSATPQMSGMGFIKI